ncbi:MAG: porin family protein [Deltaproteobacteria bacterium]|nr:porin family protein [Deltaproteobacteria bacterium]
MRFRVAASALILILSLNAPVYGANDTPEETEVKRQPRPAGLLRIEAPKKLILGKDTTARITFDKPDGGIPSLISNVGSVSSVKKGEDGRLVAVYQLPEEQFPQIAIIAIAGEDTALLDWISVPLYGEATINTKTEPGANVKIRIGDEVFGPAKADAKGRVKIDVTVPPGVPKGTTIATDRVGNTQKTSLELGVPEFSRVLGVCPDLGDRMLVLVTDGHGLPDEAAAIRLKTSEGELARPTMIDPGVYQSDYTVSDSAHVGEKADFTASLDGEEVSSSACQVAIRGGRLTSLELNLDPQTFFAGSKATVSVGVRFIAAAGKPAQPTSVEFSAELGEVSGVRTVSQGRYAATWTLPDRLSGKREAVIKAHAVSNPDIGAKKAVELRPGPVSRIKLQVKDWIVTADGKSTTGVTASVFDEFENAVPGVSLVAEADGEVSQFEDDDGDGVYQAVYTAPQRDVRGKDTITVRKKDGDVIATTDISLWAGRPPLALGPRIGFATNFGMISSAVFAADFGYALPFLERNLSIGFEVGYYWSDAKQTSEDDSEKIETSVWGLPLLARIAYQIPVVPFAFYFGIGGGLVVSHAETVSKSAGRSASLKALPTIAGFGGADVALGPGRVVLEVAYLHTFTRGLDVMGNLGGLVITVGYRFEFSL